MYVPDIVNPDTVDVDEVAFPKLTIDGLATAAVHVPVPVAVSVVVEY